MSVPDLRMELARDGIFNTRDLGGLRTIDGASIRPGLVIRADALHRLNNAKQGFRAAGVTTVIDLRDAKEREKGGVLDEEGIEVVHQPLLDPTFGWTRQEDVAPSELLTTRYREILTEFGSRLTAALAVIAEVVESGNGHAVAFHCSLGKDRTGLLSAALLSVLGVDDDRIINDYTRSAVATAVQLQWLWSYGYIGSEMLDVDITEGIWSARAETMRSTLAWVEETFGGFGKYAIDAGLEPEAIEVLRAGLLTVEDNASPHRRPKPTQQEDRDHVEGR